MVGTAWRLCPKCFNHSRDNRAWYCSHCDYLRPKIEPWKVTALRAEPIPEPKPRSITMKEHRRIERDRLAKDIADLKRPDISKLRVKVGLRVLPK